MIADYSKKNAWLRPFKNSSKLLAGRAVRGVLSIGYLAFATRSLGVEGFGTLAILYSTIMVLRSVLGFQSWQMVLRYGAKAVQRKDGSYLIQLCFFALGAELLAASIGTIFVFFYTPTLLSWFDVPAEVSSMLQLFSISLFVILASDVTLGIIRLFDRHDIISKRNVLEGVIRFIGAFAALLFAPTLWTFVWVWFMATFISHSALFLVGIKVLSKEVKKLYNDNAKITPKTNPFKAPEPGLWRYLGSTSIEYSIGEGVTYLIPLLVASVLGPMGVGLYNVAQRFANIMEDFIQKVLRTAIYTDMAWLNTSGNASQRRRMVLRSGALSGALALLSISVLIAVGPWLIALIAGPEFAESYSTMVVLACASIISATTFAFEPLLMTAGKVNRVIIGRLFAVSIYLALLLPLVHLFGMVGAAFALIARNCVFALFAVWGGHKLLKETPPKDIQSKNTPPKDTQKGTE